MAAVGYTPISLYYTTNSATLPSTSNLVLGELALNIGSGVAYFKNAAGTSIVALNDPAGTAIAMAIALG
jgi:hypothetical protein